MSKFNYLEFLKKSRVSVEKSDSSVSVRIENFTHNDMPYETGLCLLAYMVDCCEQFEKGRDENDRLKSRIAELETPDFWRLECDTEYVGNTPEEIYESMGCLKEDVIEVVGIKDNVCRRWVAIRTIDGVDDEVVVFDTEEEAHRAWADSIDALKKEGA